MNVPGLPTTIVVSPNPVGVGQSVVNGTGPINSINNLPAYDIASISPNGPPPAQALDGPNPNAIQQLFRFPSDTPPYYMSFSVGAYSRASWVSVGTLTETSRIILPLPQTMIDNHNIRYDVSDLGPAGAAGFSLINGQVAQAAAQAGVAGVQALLGQAASGAGAAGAGATNAVKGALAAAGIAVNDFMTVMLKGPDYKKRDFLWRFSPKTAQETQSLRRIIQLINNSMAPTLTGPGSAFFKWPSIWQPEFVYNGIDSLLSLNTFKMKKSVLTDFSTNYTPNGVFSPFASTKAPTSIDVRMSFLELEFWLSGDFSDIPPTTSTTPALSNPGNVPPIGNPLG